MGGRDGLLDFSLHGVHRVRDGKISCMGLVWDAGVLIGKAKIPMA